jgi:hypothetical protein
MAQASIIYNVLIVGFTKDEIQVIDRMMTRSQGRSFVYRINQWAPLEKIDFVLIDIDNDVVVRKWREISAKRTCPHVVYIGAGGVDYYDLLLDNLLLIDHEKVAYSSCKKPLRSKRLLNKLDNVTKVCRSEINSLSSVPLGLAMLANYGQLDFALSA